MRTMKAQLYADLSSDVFEAYERAVSLADESVLREDFKEGLRAMAGKRTPQFDALDPALGYIEMGDPAAGC